MKLKSLIFILSIIPSVSSPVYASSSDETQLFHLLHPSFEELISEVIEDKVTNFINMSEHIINEALDKQFHRIEHMSFSNQE